MSARINELTKNLPSNYNSHAKECWPHQRVLSTNSQQKNEAVVHLFLKLILEQPALVAELNVERRTPCGTVTAISIGTYASLDIIEPIYHMSNCWENGAVLSVSASCPAHVELKIREAVAEAYIQTVIGD